jgi:magnesium transporter
MEALDSLVRHFAASQPEEMARRLEGFESLEVAKVLEKLPAESGAAVLARLSPALASEAVARLDPSASARFLKEMPVKLASNILRGADPNVRAAVLEKLPEGRAGRLREQMTYAPETAGGIMVPRVLSLSIDLTVQEAITAVRKAPEESVYYLYVTDREGRLEGVLSMRKLLLAGPREPVRDLLHRDVVSVPAHTDREEVARVMDQKGFVALPVIDAEGRLLGVVSHEEALDTVRDEAFEDLQRMAGAGGDERALSPVHVVIRKRLPWLTLNLGTAFLAAVVVGLFEDVIARLTAVAVLMPVVSAVSGNTGVQALSVIMRGLAVREIGAGNRWRVLLKEALAGVCNGAWVALLAGLVAWAWFGRPGLGLVIGTAMILNMVAANLLGAAIPLILRALGRDPAQSSSIFLTTLTDVVGFGSFLGMAGILLRLTGEIRP